MGAEPFEVSNNSYSGAPEAFGVQECPIVSRQNRSWLAEHAERASAGSRVARVGSSLHNSGQYGCCVGKCSSGGSDSVRCVRGGNDAGSVNKADSRFDDYDFVSVRWAVDAAVGPRPEA